MLLGLVPVAIGVFAVALIPVFAWMNRRAIRVAVRITDEHLRSLPGFSDLPASVYEFWRFADSSTTVIENKTALTSESGSRLGEWEFLGFGEYLLGLAGEEGSFTARDESTGRGIFGRPREVIHGVYRGEALVARARRVGARGFGLADLILTRTRQFYEYEIEHGGLTYRFIDRIKDGELSLGATIVGRFVAKRIGYFAFRSGTPPLLAAFVAYLTLLNRETD